MGGVWGKRRIFINCLAQCACACPHISNSSSVSLSSLDISPSSLPPLSFHISLPLLPYYLSFLIPSPHFLHPFFSSSSFSSLFPLLPSPPPFHPFTPLLHSSSFFYPLSLIKPCSGQGQINGQNAGTFTKMQYIGEFDWIKSGKNSLPLL